MMFLTIQTRLLVLKILKFYQKTLSFDHGFFSSLFPHGFCRFKPTCSDYTYQAVEKYGVIRGGLKGVWRVLRCNPFSKGGYDPVELIQNKGYQGILGDIKGDQGKQTPDTP